MGNPGPLAASRVVEKGLDEPRCRNPSRRLAVGKSSSVAAGGYTHSMAMLKRDRPLVAAFLQSHFQKIKSEGKVLGTASIAFIH